MIETAPGETTIADRQFSTGRQPLMWALIALAAGVFLWLNIATAMSVSPWVDEVMQVDAGVNLYLGKGWVSTAWQSQSQFEFWAANNPLYTILVYGWVKLFGFSPVIVRSLNYVLAFAIVWLIVDTCRRAELLRSTWARILLALVLICNQAFTYVYRSGRADLVTMLVVVLLFRIYVSVQPAPKRRVLLFLCSTLLLAAGLHAIPYAVLLLCLDFLAFRKLSVPDLAAAGWGCIAGGIALALLYLSHHALVAYMSQTSGYNIVGSAVQAAVLRDHVAVSRFVAQLKALSPFSVAKIILHDSSVAPLIIYLLCLTIWVWRAGQSKLRSTALIGLVAAILIPYGMLAAGRYAFYYAWMGAAPVAVIFAMALEQCWLARKHFLLAGGIVAGVAAILLGMPHDVYEQVKTAPPANYAVVEQLLHREARPGDVVYGDPVFYYAAKAANIQFYSVTYAGGRGYRHMSDDERSHVSIVIVAPEQIAESFDKLGGDWTRQGVYQLPYGSSIIVCRRTGSTQ